MIGSPARIAACCGALALLFAACSSSKPARVVTVTVPPSSPPAASTPPASPPGTTSAPPSTSATSAAPHQTDLNGTCDTLLPDDSVIEAIGGTTFDGTDQFVVGEPDPVIHRLAYLNCRYGVTGTDAKSPPAIEIGISLYDTAARAAARITATVDDYTLHGASASDTTVDGHAATMLTGGAGAGYDVPTLVVAAGQRTVAVSVADSVATGNKANSYAAALASLALKRTQA